MQEEQHNKSSVKGDAATSEVARANDSGGSEPDHRAVVATLLSVIAIMVCVVAYSPELYNLFCKVTGSGGTTQRVEASSGVVLDEMITVRFDGTVARDLNWEFQPVSREVRVHIGETVLMNFRAKNLTKRAIVGSAIYNVTPEIAGSFFNKIECFCFTEQKLAAGEEVLMPVSFFVDPEIVNDNSGRRVKEITLSYVFYEKKKPVEAAQLTK